jgi:hypothetical protein
MAYRSGGFVRVIMPATAYRSMDATDPGCLLSPITAEFAFAGKIPLLGGKSLFLSSEAVKWFENCPI